LVESKTNFFDPRNDVVFNAVPPYLMDVKRRLACGCTVATNLVEVEVERRFRRRDDGTAATANGFNVPAMISATLTKHTFPLHAWRLRGGDSEKDARHVAERTPNSLILVGEIHCGVDVVDDVVAVVVAVVEPTRRRRRETRRRIRTRTIFERWMMTSYTIRNVYPFKPADRLPTMALDVVDVIVARLCYKFVKAANVIIASAPPCKKTTYTTLRSFRPKTVGRRPWQRSQQKSTEQEG